MHLFACIFVFPFEQYLASWAVLLECNREMISQPCQHGINGYLPIFNDSVIKKMLFKNQDELVIRFRYLYFYRICEYTV